MTTEERVSVNQVKALWALNELKSPRTSKHYHDSRAPAVFQKLGEYQPVRRFGKSRVSDAR